MRVAGPISDWIVRNEDHPIVVKYLTYYGVATVAEMTIAQKGSTFCAIQIWQEARQSEKQQAIISASDAAEASAINDFNP